MLYLKGSITYIIDGQLCPFRALESVKESNGSYISLTWHWHKRVMGWESETDSVWGKKLEKDELTVLFNIVPQTAIETSITAKAPNDRPLGSNTRTNLMKENKNETKDGGWIETSGVAAAMFKFNRTSRINNPQQHNITQTLLESSTYILIKRIMIWYIYLSWFCIIIHLQNEEDCQDLMTREQRHHHDDSEGLEMRFFPSKAQRHLP